MKFVPAKWYHSGRFKAVRLIVIHCTVSQEVGTGAEAVATYFALGARRASTHRVGDNNSVVQCVLDGDTAFGAAGANSDGLHLELVGLPTQSDVQWQDPYSLAEFRQVAPTIREWATEHSIPARWLTVDQVADGVSKGFCTHADVSKAFPDVSTGHWDPGPNFPKSVVMDIWFPPPPIPPSPIDLGDAMAVLIQRASNRKEKIFLLDAKTAIRASEDAQGKPGIAPVGNAPVYDADEPQWAALANHVMFL